MWGKLPHIFYCGRLRRQLLLNVSESLEGIVAEALARIGFELVDLRHAGSRSRPVVEVRVDRRDGKPVTVDDCARASRMLEQELDASPLVSERYVLEVSSPGVERPLRTARDWRRFVGHPAQVTSRELGGRVEVDILAVEEVGGHTIVVVRTPGGEERRMPLASMSDARLAFHW